MLLAFALLLMILWLLGLLTSITVFGFIHVLLLAALLLLTMRLFTGNPV